jgi:hypothetical protein
MYFGPHVYSLNALTYLDESWIDSVAITFASSTGSPFIGELASADLKGAHVRLFYWHTVHRRTEE